MRTRRRFLIDLGMGFPGRGPGRDAASRWLCSDRRSGHAGLDTAGRQAALRSQGQERDLAVHDRGHQPLESFDPKPALNRYAGKTIAETPFADALKSKLTGNLRVLLQDEPTSFTFAGAFIRFRSAIASGASAGRRSATGGRTWAHASTTWLLFARCGRQTTTTGRSFNSTQGGTCSRASFRRSARGFTMGLARSER